MAQLSQTGGKETSPADVTQPLRPRSDKAGETSSGFLVLTLYIYTPYLQPFFPTAIRTLHQQAATTPTPQHATAGDGGAGSRRSRRGGDC